MFDDPDWLSKLVTGTLIVLISSVLTPILIGLLGYAIVAGYALEVLANVRRGEPYPMPAWRDRWGEWLILGLKLFVAVIVWILPVILLSIPLAIGSGLVDQRGGEIVGAFLLACFGCLTLLWILVVLLATPAIYVRLAETEEISSALQFGEILEFTRDHLGDVLIAVIVYLVASMVVSLLASVIGTVLCLVGLVITIPAGSLITMLIQSHLYAQVGMGASGTKDLEPA
jgi:hypothetical protein